MVGKLISHTSPKSASRFHFLALANRPGVCYYNKGISNHLSGRLRLRRSRKAPEAFFFPADYLRRKLSAAVHVFQ